MINKLRLIKLTLIGFRKNYIVPFKNGLNFISGPTSTGKSSIAEMINYALGSEKHKDYIEIRNSCSDVELEFNVGNKRYKVIRPLFDFNRPLKLFKWQNDLNDYNPRFNILDIDSPSNENSLSAFLLKELDLYNIKAANQTFSFRDLFKYCYIKQTAIDSENLLFEKHYYGEAIKRKPTLEIIFNIYDALLADLKLNLKNQREKLEELKKRRNDIYEFLDNLKLLNFDEYTEQKNKYQHNLKEKKRILYDIKLKGKFDDSLSLSLENQIVALKNDIGRLSEAIYNQKQYEIKLTLLRNQYMSEIEKLHFLIEGATYLTQFEFELCPCCLNKIEKKVESGCSLCGSSLNTDADQIGAIKSELRSLKTKFSKLGTYIGEQKKRLDDIMSDKNKKIIELNRIQAKLDDVRKSYISPYIEQIENLNFEIGEVNNKIIELDKKFEIFGNFQQLNADIVTEINELDKLKGKIKDIEDNAKDKTEVVKELTETFESILSQFSFPKLSNAFIGEKDYLPYVRGRKYDELGSLGAVTMITMAYFLTILLCGIHNNNNHPGLIIIDTPRKNLGSEAKKGDDEFKDEKIYHSIINCFLHIHEKYQEKLQMIVINNGYPDFLPNNLVVKEFDGDGTKELPYGLIDDVLS